ncbi:UDP-glucose/GDP-mannose dehydrogenase family protein, partial [archaeon]|nr:UDP-glucose/GDP-mannose dehydrogenase family protein [archaeon]
IANLCERVDADVEDVAKGMGLDKRIGKQFLNAGAGYGGSCFPKDVKALQKIAQDNDLTFKIIRETENVNKTQKVIPVKKLKKEFDSLKDKKIVLLGLAFKPNTDDMREASSIEVIKALEKEGAIVTAVDPVASVTAKQIFPDLQIVDSAYEAAKNADALILVTEWDEFKELDFEKLGNTMNSKIIVDGRNIYDKDMLKGLGFKYVGIGR